MRRGVAAERARVAAQMQEQGEALRAREAEVASLQGAEEGLLPSLALTLQLEGSLLGTPDVASGVL